MGGKAFKKKTKKKKTVKAKVEESGEIYTAVLSIFPSSVFQNKDSKPVSEKSPCPETRDMSVFASNTHQTHAP